MKDFVTYIIQSGICLSIFVLIYRLFLHSTTFFRFNRIYLMVGLIASLLIPFIQFSYDVYIPVGDFYGVGLDKLATDNTQSSTRGLNVWQIIVIIYVAGVLVQLTRNIRSYRKFYNLIKSGIQSKTSEYILIENNAVRSAFSVFKYIFINSDQLSSFERKVIIEHETSHIRQKHGLDLFCSELVLLLQWFNPLMWLYMHSQKENHEYLADRSVLQTGCSPAVYQAILVNQRFQDRIFSFGNSFNQTNHLNRLTMLKKVKTTPWKRMATIALVPAFGLFFWASAKPSYVLQLSESDHTVAAEPLTPEVLVPTRIPADVKKSNSTQVQQKKEQTQKTALYIVDGVEKDTSALEQINPKDIVAIKVLKNDTAIRVYGERAKNEVIEITSKKDSVTVKVIRSDVE